MELKTDRLLLIEQDINEPLEIDLPVDSIIHGASNAYPAAFRENPVDTIMSKYFGDLSSAGIWKTPWREKVALCVFRRSIRSRKSCRRSVSGKLQWLYQYFGTAFLLPLW